MIYCIVGSSGSGKTRIGEWLKNIGIPEAISWTTRSPRINEIDGENYYFIDISDINKEPSPCSTIYSGNHYGTWASEFDKAEDMFCVVDKKGASDLLKYFPLGKVSVIFVSCPQDIRYKRMIERGDSIEHVNQRISFSIETKEDEPYETSHYIIENIEWEKTIEYLKQIFQYKLNNNE